MNDDIKDKSLFDALVELHNDVKSFKINNSATILYNYADKEDAKFNRYPKNSERIANNDSENKDPQRPNLSSTTVCTYTLTKYSIFWDENECKNGFKHLNEYYAFIIKTLSNLSIGSNLRPEELYDEFSILNILSLLKKIEDEVKEEDSHNRYDAGEKNNIIKIIRELCKQYLNDQFNYSGERPHPFIYYKFLIVVKDWSEEIFNDIQANKHKWNKIQDNNNKIKSKDDLFHYFFDTIYDDAKYELYRQISLYNSNDKTLFDVKRLIYSLLIAKKNDRYSNNLIKDMALKVIFEEQFKPTGLLPIGHVVNTDFRIGENCIIEKNPINTTPILSSMECFNDLLTHENLSEDLEIYHENFRLVYEWIVKRLRKSPNGNLLGWYPEYESKHKPESWVGGHTLLFLKNYCDMLSRMIEKNARQDLHYIEPNRIAITWGKLYDSYNIKKYIEDDMIENPKSRSVLIFGPPGTGKSTIAKALANEKNWNYVELTPGLFTSKGNDKIISQANWIFKRLTRMKKTVIFFDEVDRLVQSRDKGDTGWIVPALLPLFSDLWKEKEIIFVLATNKINEVDTAITRTGRVDLVLPMGGIHWRSRLKILIKEIQKMKDPIREILIKNLFQNNNIMKNIENNCLFCWYKIQGNNYKILREFLNQRFGIDWVNTAMIEPTNDDKTIMVSTEKNSLSIMLNDEKSKVNLKFDYGRTDKFIARMENGNLNIYDNKSDNEIKNDINSLNLVKNFLKGTNYMPVLEIERIIETIFNKNWDIILKKKWNDIPHDELYKAISSDESYKIFFMNEGSNESFINREFVEFHNDLKNLKYKSITKPPVEIDKDKINSEIIVRNVFE